MSDDVTANKAQADESEDWPAKATQTVVGYVDTVRTATTGKALVASRAAVYVLALGRIGVRRFVLLLVLLIRLLTSLTALLPFIDTCEVWLSYLILATLFMGTGMVLCKKKED